MPQQSQKQQQQRQADTWTETPEGALQCTHVVPRTALCVPDCGEGLGSQRITTMRLATGAAVLVDDWRRYGRMGLPSGAAWTGTTEFQVREA